MADGVITPASNAQTAHAVGWPAREKRFTAAEYDRMAAAGLMREPGKHELWDGRVMMTPPADGPHSNSESKVVEKLIVVLAQTALISQFKVYTGAGLQLNDHNLLGPDVMVLRADMISADRRPEPAAVALLIEIADSSLEDDLGTKRDKYAGSGIPEYWVVDVQARALHVFRAPAHGAYTSVSVSSAGEVRPLFAPDLALAVEAMV